MDRRLFIASTLASPMLTVVRAEGTDLAHRSGVFVPSGQDRNKETLRIWGVIPLEV
jgi:hypothetical protein